MVALSNSTNTVIKAVASLLLVWGICLVGLLHSHEKGGSAIEDGHLKLMKKVQLQAISAANIDANALQKPRQALLGKITNEYLARHDGHDGRTTVHDLAQRADDLPPVINAAPIEQGAPTFQPSEPSVPVSRPIHLESADVVSAFSLLAFSSFVHTHVPCVDWLGTETPTEPSLAKGTIFISIASYRSASPLCLHFQQPSNKLLPIIGRFRSGTRSAAPRFNQH